MNILEENFAITNNKPQYIVDIELNIADLKIKEMYDVQ